MRSTDQVLGDLVQGLEPVRPIPRLRTVVASALALGAVASLLLLWVSGLRADLAAAALRPSLAGVAVGLTIVALGGIATSLGGSVPGREGVARFGLRALVAGLGLAAAAAGWGLISTGVAAWEGMGLSCLATAVLVGLLPSVPLVAFLARALPRQPAAGLAAAAAGAVALGGLSVHASCPATGGMHVLVGHALAPLLGGLFLGAILYPLLLRLRRPG
jgi:hypothetical protein